MPPKKNPTQSAVDLTNPQAGRAGLAYFPGIAERDVALVERTAEALAKLATGLRENDQKACAEAHAALRTLGRDADRIRLVARRAMTREG